MKSTKKISLTGTSVAGLAVVLLASFYSLAVGQSSPEVFQAQAMGQGTQMGQTFGVTVHIEEYSTPEDQQILLAAFNKAGNQGLVNALGKMHPKGRMAITGTLGYDVTYIRQWPTANGRKIRLVTNRPIRFGESWADSRSSDYNLSAIELDLSKEKGKSTGILLPACQLKASKTGGIEIENYQNPWKLVDILDRNPKRK